MAEKEWFLPVLEYIETWMKNHPNQVCFVSIDGMSGSGKSFLGEKLYETFGGLLLHMDDFFLRPQQKTKERRREIGGNVDYERFWEEVLEPLKAGKTELWYRPYNCKTQTLSEGRQLIQKGNLCVTEGSYSQHPYFQNAYDIRIVLTISPGLQRERILKRNGSSMLARFLDEWIPMENTYLKEFQIVENSHIHIQVPDCPLQSAVTFSHTFLMASPRDKSSLPTT